ncbi:vWA domain-containing protein [Gemmobacter denitrificans]
MLKAALRGGLPPAQDAARLAALSAALDNFDQLQENEPAPRSSQVHPRKAGWLTGAKAMMTRLSSARILAATTSAAALAVALVAVAPALRQDAPLSPPLPSLPRSEPVAAQTPDPAPAPMAAQAPAAAPAKPAEALSDMAMEEPMAAEEPMVLMEQAPAFAEPMARRAALPQTEAAAPEMADTESFANAPANPVRLVQEDPVSTFSVDVDTAAYSLIRRFLQAGEWPDPAAVRIEEMVNYFPYAYPQPTGSDPFRADVTVFPTPWNDGTRLVRIGLQGRLPEVADRPPLNLVFLVDTSGSMDAPDKLPLLKQALRLVLPQLRAGDQVALVAYAGSAGVVLEPTAASETAAISAALDRLAAGGGTAGAEGLTLAYQQAALMAAPGEVSRVLLATDGDFNLGISDPAELETFIARQREGGTYLSVLGFGRGNLDDATMQALAQAGNGMASYIDTAQEARKVLVDQLSGALFPLADDVKLQVEWNPAKVAEYRLIGYETRALAREDFNNDRVDAGEIGAGHQVTALYEITPQGSAARLTDPLRYGAAPEGQVPADASDELGFLKLRWKAPGQADSQLIATPILDGTAAPDAEARFAAAIAGFGQLLTGGQYLNGWGWDQAIALAEGARGDDPFGYRVEAVNLMRLAASLPR